MTLKDLIDRKTRSLNEKIARHNDLASEYAEAREAETPDEAKIAELRESKAKLAAEITQMQADVAALRSEADEDDKVARMQEKSEPVAETRETAYDQVARVGHEERTYRADHDPRGGKFVRDVIAASISGDYGAQERLRQHMAEERVERAAWLNARAATGTSAFAGLVVPQYLTDLVAPKAAAGRPLANAMRKLPMPAEGMTLDISRITTSTSAAVQTEGSAASETNIDDTLLAVSVQTIAGSQTVTRQAVERGSGALDVTLEDLMRQYNTTLDSTIINQATNGLTNVATSIAYTDASPTAAELYPKLLSGVAAVEAALLDQDPGDTIAVMHSRRWYWVQSQLSSTFPLIGQGFSLNVAGMADAQSRYGSGFRGFLPSGVPVIVDNNIATNLGAGTNEDEIYFVSQSESFLWEDPSAPMLIRTETGPSVKSLGVDVVVYGYAAYTFARQTHAQKIGGTGLVTPTF